jgi:hypothetical protein
MFSVLGFVLRQLVLRARSQSTAVGAISNVVQAAGAIQVDLAPQPVGHVLDRRLGRSDLVGPEGGVVARDAAVARTPGLRVVACECDAAWVVGLDEAADLVGCVLRLAGRALERGPIGLS